jgi:hypothetical protein
MKIKGSIPTDIDILKGPLSLKALKARTDKDGRISVNIVVSLEDLLQHSRISDLNDLMDEKILRDETCLSDINYKVVGAVLAPDNTPEYLDGSVILNVNADVSDLI